MHACRGDDSDSLTSDAGPGGGMQVLRESGSAAELYGIDIDPKHVELSRETCDSWARITRASMVDLAGSYDVALVSNVLEHLADWRRGLERVCRTAARVYVMVPFNEHIPIELRHADTPSELHVESFTERTFSELDLGDVSIETRVIQTPGAWGFGFPREARVAYRTWRASGRWEWRRQLLVAITRQPVAGGLPLRPLHGRWRAGARSAMVRCWRRSEMPERSDA